MADTDLTAAAQACVDADLQALNSLKTLSDTFMTGLADLSATVPFPATYPSRYREVASALQNNLGSIVTFTLPAMIASMTPPASPTDQA